MIGRPMVRLETLYRQNKSRATRLGALLALSILLATIVAAQFVARDPRCARRHR